MTKDNSFSTALKAVIIVSTLTGLSCCSVKAKTAETPTPQTIDSVVTVKCDSLARIPNPAPLIMRETDRAYDVVEEMPRFPGGDGALMDYLKKNVHYPEELKDSCFQGRVIVMFVVEKDGSIADAKVVRSLHPALDQEALRVVNAMPKWHPGKQNGVPVRVKCVLPVSFQLQESKPILPSAKQPQDTIPII